MRRDIRPHILHDSLSVAIIIGSYNPVPVPVQFGMLATLPSFGQLIVDCLITFASRGNAHVYTKPDFHDSPYSRWHLNFQSLGSGYSENSILYGGIIISLTIRSGKDR